MNSFEAMIYGLVQGVTEFIPVSSSGHLALLPKFLGIEDPGVEFDLVMHMGTAFAVICYYHKRLQSYILALWDYLKNKKKTGDLYFTCNLIIATLSSIPLIILFKKSAESYGRGPSLIIFNLVFFGVLMFMIDKYKKNDDVKMSHQHRKKKAVLIGLAQALAIFPGVSRSGITVTIGRALGLSRQEASHFSFLLSLPIIFGGIFLMLPEIFEMKFSLGLKNCLIGLSVSFMIGLCSIHFFIKLFTRFGLFPFMLYRIILAALVGVFVL